MNKWSSYGLKSWKVVKMPSDQAFCVMALLEWGSMGEFQKAGECPEIKDIVRLMSRPLDEAYQEMANTSDRWPM